MSPGSFPSNFFSWQEDVIYFLMVDRFHDGRERESILTEKRIQGFGKGEELKKSCGGNLRGVIRKLDYIKNLGCSAIWLSPVLENNPESYHGYSIQNFLKVDPRLGTEQDLVELVHSAHKLNLKVYLDAVINHSGNNWTYKGNEEKYYQEGKTYELGAWREEGLPQPETLRNPGYYFRKGMIRNWDTYPETRMGDFFSLKKFRLDESKEGLEVQNILAEIYEYWIKVTDCDGLRIDAAKHAGEAAVGRFCARIRKFANQLGKKDFFLFAEIPAADTFSSTFFNSLPSHNSDDYQSPDTLFDFPLHFMLKKMITGKKKPDLLKARFQSREKFFPGENKNSLPLINFLDNHDQIENPYKKRIATDLSNEQLLAALGVLFTLPGVPCLYYGTEQGFEGKGESDSCIREAMFDFRDERGKDCLNADSFLYKEIGKLAALRKKLPELMYGRLSWPQLIYRDQSPSVAPLVYQRELNGQKTLVGYNGSNNEKLEFFVEFKYTDTSEKVFPEVLYSNFLSGERAIVEKDEKAACVKIVLSPEQFIILK